MHITLTIDTPSPMLKKADIFASWNMFAVLPQRSLKIHACG